MVMISYLRFFIMSMSLPTISVYGFSKNYTTSTFNQSFSRLFGDNHIVFLDDEGNSVQISLDQSTGSGFMSRVYYYYAYFSASIKLPADYTAGVVVTFYTSNSNIYQNFHDELDFEFLGNVRGQNWVVQTNVYGNGSTSRGREGRYNLWFDPTQDSHTYSILWVSKWIIFYVDNVPIREIRRVDAMGGDFPSKPMSLYATIWDGSSWATGGGKYKVNYQYAPFIAMYSDFVLYGCSVNPTQKAQACHEDIGSDLNATFSGLTSQEKMRMKNFRSKYLKYSYCDDRARYSTPLPECVIDPQEARKLQSEI